MNGETAVVLREEQFAAPVLSAGEIKHRVQVIAQIMRDVMEDKVHYGEIPGTAKPSLWQPGAEKLCLAFGISIRCEPLEERITEEEVFYRVRAYATSATGHDLGTRDAVCSTREKKYRWRRPVHPKEFDSTPEHLRRVTWDKEGNEILQVRTDPGDQAETILQMASKRAHVALTRQVTGCSDMFAQELEEDDEPPKSPGRASEAGAAAPAEPGEIPEGAHLIASSKPVKKGENADGPWTLFVVKTKGGRSFTTFSQSIATAATKAMNEGYAVRIVGEVEQEGRDPKIVELVKA